MALQELYGALKNIVDVLNNIDDAKSYVGLVMREHGKKC